MESDTGTIHLSVVKGARLMWAATNKVSKLHQRHSGPSLFGGIELAFSTFLIVLYNFQLDSTHTKKKIEANSEYLDQNCF